MLRLKLKPASKEDFLYVELINGAKTPVCERVKNDDTMWTEKVLQVLLVLFQLSI